MLDNKILSKVFMWMALGLAITFGVGYYVSLNANMLYNIFSKFYWFIVIAEFVVVIVLSARIRKMKSETAKIMFCLYSFLTGLTFSSIFVVYEITSIVYVFGITSILLLLFSLIGSYTKLDLSKISTYLFMALLGIVICSIVNMFIKSEMFDLGLCIIGVVVFVIYIAYDIQVVKRNLYGIENQDNLAIYGALNLYLDFINIFIKLLKIFGKNRD